MAKLKLDGKRFSQTVKVFELDQLRWNLTSFWKGQCDRIWSFWMKGLVPAICGAKAELRGYSVWKVSGNPIHQGFSYGLKGLGRFLLPLHPTHTKAFPIYGDMFWRYISVSRESWVGVLQALGAQTCVGNPREHPSGVVGVHMP